MAEDRVREIIREEVVSIVQGQILNLFCYIMTAMMEFFDDQYAALSDTVVAVRSGTGRSFQYRDFKNTKPLTFDRV